jgi:hypothetical protein
MSITALSAALDRGLFLKLAVGDWIRARHNLLVTGPTGLVT